MTSPNVFYVSPRGDDTWSGRSLRAGGDAPFATLERARDAVRELKRTQGGKLARPVTVWIRGGSYQLDRPLELTAEDSGTLEAPVSYRAFPGEEVRLSGGRVVTGFERVTDPAVLARLDPKARRHVWQANLRALGITEYGQATGGFGMKDGSPGLELFFADQRMTLARWPNEGFVQMGDVLGVEPISHHGLGGCKEGKFRYEGDRPSRWVGESDGRLHGYWFFDWADYRHKIESIDPEQSVLSLAPPYHGYGYRKGQWYYAFNLLSELDVPGEWYLDRERGTLYFWPPGPMRSGQPTVSAIGSLVAMRGVAHVTVAGITLEATRGDVVTIEGGAHNRLVGCALRNCGGAAVKVAGGLAHSVLGCDISETGGGGIILEGGDRRKLQPAWHNAENNHIHHFSRWHRMYHPGISLNGVGLRAAHNLLHDAPHMGVFFSGNEHVIEFNEIHHVCEESNDAGAIYGGRDWSMRGTAIRHNYLHHLSGHEGRGCVGVYLDDCISGIAISGNVFHQVARAAFVGGGRDNTIVNNLFVDCLPAVHVDARGKGWAKFWFDGKDNTLFDNLKAVNLGQPPYSRRYPRLQGIPDDDPAAPKGTEVRRNLCVGGRWLEVDDMAAPFVQMEDNLVGPGLEQDLAALGDLELPRAWEVFGPWEAPLGKLKEPPFRTDDLSRVPTELVSGGRTLTHHRMELEDVALDFGKCLCGGWNPDAWSSECCQSVMAFSEVVVAADAETSLGVGADWWLRVWVNGRLECDTTAAGNSGSPPRITDQIFTVRLRKGVNVIAIQVISGKHSFALAVGGPRELGGIQQRARGSFVDLGFANPANQDFRLRDDSPAYAIGFKSIPFESIGLYQDERRASWPPNQERVRQ